MPFSSNSDLPAKIKDAVPSEAGQSLFRRVVNSSLEAGNSEAIAFASAWAALFDAGYNQNDKGKWIKKVEKAEYQGREVELDQPFRLPSGSSKKFGVYVKDGDKVKRVTFGDPNMEIKRDNPEARANFRARHSCDTAKDKTSARYWSCRMWEPGVSVSELTKEQEEFEKRQVNDDIFTMPVEAIARSIDLGLEGTFHIVSGDNGQAYYMPGPDHDTYLKTIAERAGIEMEEVEEPDMPTEEESEPMLERAINAILSFVSKQEGKGLFKQHTPSALQGSVLKVDEDQHIVWGWASVISKDGEPVVDQQGDVISADVMVEAATEFMLNVRAAKAMHVGDTIGEVVHSMPLTKELAQSLGIEVKQEGWVIAMKIHDDEVWQKVKTGEYGAFSIGGVAAREAA